MKLMLSIVWFIVGLVGFLAAELTYGWRAVPLAHAWHAIAWAVLDGWILVGARVLHRSRPVSRPPRSPS